MGHRLWRWVANHWVMVVGLIILAYLFLPIAIVIIMSFKEPIGRNAAYSLDNYTFTFDNWAHPCRNQAMCSAVTTSLQIGILATIVATILGTLIAFAMVRHRFTGRAPVNMLIFLPMATPEVVMGSSLLSLFTALHFPVGFRTILIAHVMFCISFVVVTVKARLAGMDPRLEEAAMDLYATPRQTFRRVTFPLVLPGIVAAALLSFSLSFDDYIITSFSAGASATQTFPLYVYGAQQRGIPAQINVIATAMFLISFIIVIIGQILNWRRARTVS
jgi:spermidine/putrescine transport system permease protein